MLYAFYGSVSPKMLLPLAIVGGWVTMITCINKYVWPLDVNSYVHPDDPLFTSVLPTVVGFVVGLALSFRSSTAYEQYTEGRK